MEKFYVSTDSTADLFKSEIEELKVFFLPLSISYTKGDTTEVKPDNFQSHEEYVEFFNKLRNGYVVKTSMNNNYIHEEYFRGIAKQGVKKLIHFTISSGLARTKEVAAQAIEEVRKEYPDFECVVIDPLSTTVGQGLLVRIACEMRDGGKTLEETAEYCNKIKHHLQHYILVSNLDYLKAGGRISGFAAQIGKLAKLTITIDFDKDGKLCIRNKAIGGLKKGISNIVKGLTNHKPMENSRCIVAHTDNPTGAEMLAKEIEKVSGIVPEIRIIGPTIGAHVGPDGIAYIFLSEDTRK
ncbi:MAG: DegV family protein [Clostridia bacterium]|nr:DegV family protein [Clostridia bacterium]